MDQKTKHTPGPWTAAVYSATPSIIERLKQQPQAAVCLNHDHTQASEMLVALCGDAEDPQSQADAHLIAAAPEMLDALKRIIKVANGSIADKVECIEKMAKIAINKATGGAK